LVKSIFTPTLQYYPHPEMGFAGWGGDLLAVYLDQIQKEVKAGYPLLRCHTDLSKFRNRDLTQTELNSIDKGLGVLRTAGAKCIPRFAYAFPNTSTEDHRTAQDAPLSQILKHIEQLGPILKKNADVIAYTEAGFIGA